VDQLLLTADSFLDAIEQVLEVGFGFVSSGSTAVKNN